MQEDGFCYVTLARSSFVSGFFCLKIGVAGAPYQIAQTEAGRPAG
jgi:hypothetical protein